MRKLLANFGRNAIRVTVGRTVPGQLSEILERRLAFGRKLGRIFVTQLGEREAAAVGDFDRPRDGVRGSGE